MMTWFGESWDADLCFECDHIETPVGQPCSWCEEEIAEGDRGVTYSNGPVAHLHCFIRGTIGSVAHIRKECSCFVFGSTCGDPEGMTKREAATAAVKEYFGEDFHEDH